MNGATAAGATTPPSLQPPTAPVGAAGATPAQLVPASRYSPPVGEVRKLLTEAGRAARHGSGRTVLDYLREERNAHALLLCRSLVGGDVTARQHPVWQFHMDRFRAVDWLIVRMQLRLTNADQRRRRAALTAMAGRDRRRVS